MSSSHDRLFIQRGQNEAAAWLSPHLPPAPQGPQELQGQKEDTGKEVYPHRRRKSPVAVVSASAALSDRLCRSAPRQSRGYRAADPVPFLLFVLFGGCSPHPLGALSRAPCAHALTRTARRRPRAAGEKKPAERLAWGLARAPATRA